jgi:hypothetical protein
MSDRPDRDSDRNEKTAPVQRYGRIPWDLHVRAWGAYAAKYGKYQSAERIAERGGFDVNELDVFLPGWRDELTAYAQLAAARERIAALEAEIGILTAAYRTGELRFSASGRAPAPPNREDGDR